MKIKLWTEGYAATGERAGAMCHGEFEGETLRDAVIAYRASLNSRASRECVDVDRLTFWGCQFFDNEADARKSFG